ncbi:MAG TPA: right-handed parallel beta-helix repeat-containing protein [Blastocatellia bacterium]|nr:right-handed parallel beta-helix repeat-containing protein [Blastocatellia bacterium]
MNRTLPLSKLLLFFTFILLSSSSAFAQATRTWVSGVGDDDNPCSRTAPCKTFAGAISKTAAGGEINVIDPGGFGAVTITKSITIDGGPYLSGILAAGTNGIIVNAGANDEVVIRGLDINGVNGTASPGVNGIRFIAGGTLYVERCTIYGFSDKGIDFQPSGASNLIVKDTVIRNNRGTAPAGGGILVKPGAAGSAKVFIDNVRLERGLYGIRAEDNSKVTICNSSATNNINNGFLAASFGSPVEMNIESSVSANNGTNGVVVQGTYACIRLSNVTVMNNSKGLFVSGSGSIVSCGNNRIAGNTTDGAPTQTVAEQ